VAMEGFGEDATQGIDLLGLALGRGLPGAAGADLDEFVDFEIYFDGTVDAAKVGEAVPFLRSRLCDTFEVFGAVGLEKYLWHCDRLVLEVNLGEGADEEPHLSGHLRTGDGAEDEWFVTYLLKHLTSVRPDTSCRVVDADGELLLIEAALAAPRWLTPANAENRCWLRDAKVHLLPKPRPPESQRLACSPALAKLRSAAGMTAAKDKVQAAIKNRLEGYPKRALELSTHVVRAVLPMHVARLLLAYPQLVSTVVDNLPPPATQELTRLRRELSGSAANVRFDCESLTSEDMTCVGVRFTRSQFARIMGLRTQLPQRFAQKHWRSAAGGDEKAMKLGAMICAGLEAAFLQGHKSATVALRWPSPKLNDVALFQKLPWWKDSAFARYATAKHLAISENSYLVRRAFEQQRDLDEAFRPAFIRAMESDMVKNIDLALHWCDHDDTDDWLQISSEELDQEMQRRQEEFDAYDRIRNAGGRDKGDNASVARAEAAANSEMPEELREELASMGRKLTGMLERSSCLEGVEAATTAASSPDAQELRKNADLSDSDSDQSEVDVLGMEDEAENLSGDEDDSDGGDGCSAEEMQKYMEALDEQLEDHEEQPEEFHASSREGGGEDGIPLSSHHIRVGTSDPRELDTHAMEHMLASYCAEGHFEPGPASLLLNQLGLSGVGCSSNGAADSLYSMD